ncbi:MAG: hypothetical protein CMM52_09875 [Rhodospirillaceae bacterium]|nr:hypothetical protein [Rhodospirillaceae bacterium]|tara:strand:+ start:3068 stop:3547 length:480 start_codon:yes stop_codon:yes gene_type:complete
MLDTARRSRNFASITDASERRLVGRALRNWENLRSKTPLPDRDLCLDSFEESYSDSVIVIAMGKEEKEDRVIHCGREFRDALARDPTGLPVKQIMPSMLERGLVFWRVAAEMKKPIADVGGFTNASGNEILYRSVFLPVTVNGGNVTHLIGAFSYKTVH